MWYHTHTEYWNMALPAWFSSDAIYVFFLIVKVDVLVYNMGDNNIVFHYLRCNLIDEKIAVEQIEHNAHCDEI